MVRAGSLRHRVQIERATEALDSLGEATLTWSAIGSAWASISALGSSERSRARGIEAGTTHEIRMRTADVTARDRITLGARTFEVTGVADPTGRGTELRVYAQEAG